MESNKYYPFLSLGQSNAPYAARLKEAAARVIDSGRFLGGPETAAFERELADYLGARFCIGVSNGLDAIRLIFRAYMELGKLSAGDEVIIPANTFVASVLPVAELGLCPVMMPVDPADMNLDWHRVEDFITPRTRAVMPVHLYGTTCWNPDVCRSLHDRGILIIEDNAQAVGALAQCEGLNGSRNAGALGDAAAISFYPTKNLGALGDGGAVVTSDEELARTVRTLANYGADRRYHNIYRGYNNRLDELQAAFLRVKLGELDTENDRRREVANAYNDSIINPIVHVPEIFTDRRQVWHQYVIRSPHRDQLKEFLECHGILTDIHYAVPPHMQPCFNGELDTDPSLEEAREMADSLLSLPIANLTPADARDIAAVINLYQP
ncbi:MAG: DegT/DnrJ/EryC1/StrS family aminotransferase [Muribaculaceae bacterium]|nr:DegT/DnrJ/EryC1/StrS family aminotransferase [Muribaculaceae bacterium]